MALPRNSLTTYKEAWNDLDELNTVWLITWNPKPRFYNYNEGHDNAYEIQWWTMLGVLTHAKDCMDLFAFVPEVSEKGKLHMHGFFVLKDKYKYYKQFLPMLERNGKHCIRKANSHKWKTFKYHVKDIRNEMTQIYLPHDNFVLTHHNCKLTAREYATRYTLLANKHTSNRTRKDPIKKRNVLEMLNDEGLLLSSESSDSTSFYD